METESETFLEPAAPPRGRRGYTSLALAAVFATATVGWATTHRSQLFATPSAATVLAATPVDLEKMPVDFEPPKPFYSPYSAPLANLSAKPRLGSFLVIGDWGWDSMVHGNVESAACVQAIADKMLEAMRNLTDVQFIINVGDSFYPNGVKDKNDPQWDTKWRSIFHEELRSVPWYSVYGNHDYHADSCACEAEPAKCAQVNGDHANRDFFFMPSYNWWYYHHALKVEVVGLDFNHLMWAWNKDAPANKRCATDCFWTSCHPVCEGNLRYRAKEALDMLKERTEQSAAENLIVFSHYPTDYFWTHTEVLDRLSNKSRKIDYFGGHRHNVDQSTTLPTLPNNNWLVGGGGGWSCDTPKGEEPQQGFVVGEIREGERIATYPILVDARLCCAPPAPPGPPPPPGTPQPFCFGPPPGVEEV